MDEPIFNVNNPNAGEPESKMSRSGTVPAEALFGPINQEPDDVPEWAQGQTFEQQESMRDLIKQMYPDARPYRPRGGEHDGE
jgi:hypothetical protein